MGKRLEIVVIACCATAVGALLIAGVAFAAFPGTNGKIAFVHDSGTPGSNLDIFAMDPTGLNRTALTSTPDNDLYPSWSGDGERIAFTRYPAGGPVPGEIWVMNHDGTGQTQLSGGTATTDDFDPAFSADGKKIAFDRYDGSSVQIWIMNADGTGQTQLTFPGANGAEAFSPSFSPDGQKIVFGHYDTTVGFNGISVMNPDGSSGQTPLTTGSATAEDFAPNFSPDGQRIVFERYNSSGAGDYNIFVMNANGSGQTAVTNTAADQDFAPAFSPQGTQVAFERDDSAFSFGNIFLADPNGLNQGLTPLTTNGAPAFDFAPDWQPLNPPTCDLTGKPTSKSVKKVSVTVTCANENATVVAEGSGKAPKVPKGAVISKAKKFKIPAVTSQAQAGAPTTITLKISKKGQKALKKAAKAGKKGKATITATLTDELGQSSSDSFKVKFKPKKH
jgi:Tol biopolymer transport system component